MKRTLTASIFAALTVIVAGSAFAGSYNDARIQREMNRNYDSIINRINKQESDNRYRFR